MKMVEHSTSPQNSPTYLVSVSAFLCIPSFLHSSFPFLAMSFTPVPSSIENMVFPPLVIDNRGNNLVRDEGLNIRAIFKAS